MPFQTHLSALEAAIKNHPTSAALKVAHDGPTGLVWNTVTYSALDRDTQACARYWAKRLPNTESNNERPVVGLWLKGASYTDVVHIWGMSRAGFIPQLISLRMTDPSVVYQLLSQARAVALIHDDSDAEMLKNSPLPAYAAKEPQSFSDTPGLLPPSSVSPDAHDVLMIYHTSGSTSGIPKLVPLTAKWIDCLVRKTLKIGDMLPSSGRQLVTVAIGSLSHMGSTMLLLESLSRGGCFVLPTQIPYPFPELQGMISQCGLTRLNVFPPFLSDILYEARRNPPLLDALQTLDYITYGGLALDPTDEAWARSRGMRLVNGFGSTELGIMMISDAPIDVPYLQPVPGSKYEFAPLQTASDFGEQLLEMVVLPDSPDCPAQSFLSPEDGKFHTGDLFVEVAPGQYISRGRNDDWIKMSMALRCDTSSIEANAMETCGEDLINVVVVVGAGRPSPAMVVELRDGKAISGRDVSQTRQIKDEILRRITPFHKRRYMHERVDDARLILVAPGGSLPRTATKGNVKRKEVEVMFKKQLDKAYLECAAETKPIGRL